MAGGGSHFLNSIAAIAGLGVVAFAILAVSVAATVLLERLTNREMRRRGDCRVIGDWPEVPVEMRPTRKGKTRGRASPSKASGPVCTGDGRTHHGSGTTA